MIAKRKVSGQRSCRVAAHEEDRETVQGNCLPGNRPILQASGHDLNSVTSPASPPDLSDGLPAELAIRNANLRCVIPRRFLGPVGIITPRQPASSLRQTVRQHHRAGGITKPTNGHEETDQPPFGIGDGVQSGLSVSQNRLLINEILLLTPNHAKETKSMGREPSACAPDSGHVELAPPDTNFAVSAPRYSWHCCGGRHQDIMTLAPPEVRPRVRFWRCRGR